MPTLKKLYIYDRELGRIVPAPMEKRKKNNFHFAARMWIMLAAFIIMTTGAYSVEDESEIVNIRRYVYVCGEVIGISSDIDGVRISDDSRYAQISGLKKDDVILSVNAASVNDSDEIKSFIEQSGGQHLNVQYQRHDELLETVIKPIYSIIEQKYRCRLNLSETKPFIGTLTYVTEDNSFSAVAHAITSTSVAQSFDTGVIYTSNVTNITKTAEGAVGTLSGTINYSESLGQISSNGANGITGSFVGEVGSVGTRYPVAFSNEITGGEAVLIALDGDGGIAYYTVEIANVNIGRGSFDVIINDENFINKFGGYTFGMSGSPIIQNDMFIGAIAGVKAYHLDRGQAIMAERLLGE